MGNRPTTGICAACAMPPVCFAQGAGEGVPVPVERRRRLSRGEKLFEAATPGGAVYAVRAGFLKVSVPVAGTDAGIVRFVLPGDAVGFDAMRGQVHACESQALEDSEVCEIASWRLETVADARPLVAAHLRRCIAEELTQAHAHCAAVASLPAATLVARFLLDLARRWAARGYSERRFRLPMGRREIGNHLGLTMETVSRVLSTLQARGAVRLERGAIEILSPALLQAA